MLFLEICVVFFVKKVAGGVVKVMPAAVAVAHPSWTLMASPLPLPLRPAAAAAKVALMLKC